MHVLDGMIVSKHNLGVFSWMLWCNQSHNKHKGMIWDCMLTLYVCSSKRLTIYKYYINLIYITRITHTYSHSYRHRLLALSTEYRAILCQFPMFAPIDFLISHPFACSPCSLELEGTLFIVGRAWFFARNLAHLPNKILLVANIWTWSKIFTGFHLTVQLKLLLLILATREGYI